MQRVSEVTLQSNSACEVEEDEDFVFETALFSNRLLKQLEVIPDRELAAAESPALKRELLYRQRQRASSVYLPSGSDSSTPVPLVDGLLRDPSFPAAHHVQKIASFLLDSHCHCPPGSLTTLGALGTGCLWASETSREFCSSETLLELVSAARSQFAASSPSAVLRLTVPAGGRLVVVGDTHSQLEDVLWIFFKHGWPKTEDVYVFNGDIVDRGNHALEIFVLLFLLKRLFPDSVHVVRGNHEASDYCVLSYGFHAELRLKYGGFRASEILHRFLDLFYHLPLCVLVDAWPGDYLCRASGRRFRLQQAPLSPPGGSLPLRGSRSGEFAVIDLATGLPIATAIATATATATGLIAASGGASTATSPVSAGSIVCSDGRRGRRDTASDVAAATIRWDSGDSEVWEAQSARAFVVHGGIPVAQQEAVSVAELERLAHRQPVPAAPRTTAEMFMYQMVWSDPKEETQRGVKSGRGTPFFPTDTEQFCRRNNLACVVRSHQLPVYQRGFQLHHGFQTGQGRLATVFSASNYCGTSMNCGAVVVWTSASFPALLSADHQPQPQPATATATTPTLLEHYAPPLSLIREIFAQHSQDAASEVRFFIANELEKQLAPFARHSPRRPPPLAPAPEIGRGGGQLAVVVEQRVLEYVRTILVKFKLEIAEKIKSYMRAPAATPVAGGSGSVGSRAAVPVLIVVDVLTDLIGPQFPWRSLLEQLNVEISRATLEASDGGAMRSEEEFVTDLVEFGNFFKATITHGEAEQQRQFGAWTSAVVHGWFLEIFEHEVQVQQALLQGPEILDVSHFRSVFAACTRTVAGRQLDRVFHALAGARTRVARQEILLMFADFFAGSAFSEALRASLVSLSDAVAAHFDGDFRKFFFEHLRAHSGSDGRLRREDFVARLRESQPRLSPEISGNYPLEDVADALANADGMISFLKFFGAMHAGRATKLAAATLADQASATIFFHRTALRCAFARLDRRGSGQVNRRAFKRALAALNTAVEEKWRLAPLQLETAIEAFAWETADEAEEQMVVEEPTETRQRRYSVVKMADISAHQPDADLSLWVTYEDFVKAFDVVDTRRMDRKGSCGWNLLRDSFASFTD